MADDDVASSNARCRAGERKDQFVSTNCVDRKSKVVGRAKTALAGNHVCFVDFDINPHCSVITIRTVTIEYDRDHSDTKNTVRERHREHKGAIFAT